VTGFGTDRSHYQDLLPASLGQGLWILTHKLTDGDHFYEDARYAAGIGQGRALGIPVLGPYHMLHGNRSISSQATWWFERTNALSPWWRADYATSSGRVWVWQADCEAFDYFTAPTVGEINAFGDAICALARAPAEQYLPYAPGWHYGAALKGLRYRNYWASGYGPNPPGDYRAAYPGDNSPRWTAAVIEALLLQYGSRTNLGDANAIRGTFAGFLTRLKAGGDTDVALKDDPDWIKFRHDFDYAMWRIDSLSADRPIAAGGPEKGSPVLGVAHARDERSAAVANRAADAGERAAASTERAAAGQARTAAEHSAADVAALVARPPVASAPVDIPTLMAALTHPTVLQAIANAVADVEHARSAE
jgi:hypothetical protein